LRIKNGQVIALAKKEKSIHPPNIHKFTSALEQLLTKSIPKNIYGKILLIEENGFTMLT